jgi:hypothetical protein
MRLDVGFRRLVLLAPPQARIPGTFRNVSFDPEYYAILLHQTQELRGAIYVEEGAIDKARLTNGRHIVESDNHSWHLLVLDGTGNVCACTRYHHHPTHVKFSRLAAAESSMSGCSVWRDKVRSALEEELALSRTLDLPFVEVGGWAIAKEIRNTVEALRMVLASYAFFRALGGAVGIATATVRHSSASILRRIGGRPLQHAGQEVPSYIDLQYNCRMEMLRFYSWAPNPRYDSWIREIGVQIEATLVISGKVPELAWILPERIFSETTPIVA